MALSKIQPASMDLTANYAFTGTNSVAGLEYAEKKLSTVTASSSATLDFTSNIDSTYNIYKFRFVNIHCETNDTHLQFQANTAGGSGFNETITSSVFEARHKEDGSSTSLAYNTGYDQAQGTSFQTIAGGVGNAADASVSGELFLFDPSSTTFVKHFTVNTQYMNYQSPPFTNEFFVAGYFNTTSAIDEIQFKMSSGNIDSGTIEMYGIN